MLLLLILVLTITLLFLVLMDGFDNKYVVIGFDKNGNLIEVMYNLIDEQSIDVKSRGRGEEEKRFYHEPNERTRTCSLMS